MIRVGDLYADRDASAFACTRITCTRCGNLELAGMRVVPDQLTEGQAAAEFYCFRCLNVVTVYLESAPRPPGTFTLEPYGDKLC